MARGKLVKELNRMLIRTKDGIHFDVFAPRDKQLLAEHLSHDEAEEFCQKHNPDGKPAPFDWETRHEICPAWRYLCLLRRHGRFHVGLDRYWIYQDRSKDTDA